ncbi:LysR family transcriptional regulator [Klebsiella pneumoniae]
MADASSVDFRALQLFIAVYDNQSFSVVARREGVSPSLISRTIQQLEDALGQQLFYRNTRAVVPTEAGRLFAASARELLGQYADAQRALQDRAQVPGGLVRINAPVYFGQRHIAPWLPELFRQREEAWVHYPLTPLMTSNNADALLTSAIGGMGIVLFPDWMVSEALHNGTLVTLMDRYSAAISHTPSYIAAIYPYTRHPSLNVRTVIDYFADVFGSPPYWQR